MGKHHSRFTCGHLGCREVGNFESSTRRDEADLYQRYSNGKWRCVRHNNGGLDVLSESNPIIVFETVSDQRDYGRFWGSFGMLYGPGFKAWAADFPTGTTLRVTAEIVLPDAGRQAIKGGERG